MKERKRIITLALGIALLFAASAADAKVSIDWTDKNCGTVMDAEFGNTYFCKADDKWDTQITEEKMAPVKWVYHKMEGNPIVWLRYDTAVSDTSAMNYAGSIRARYEARGIKVEAVTKQVVGGRDVYMVSGVDPAKDFRFIVALFWRSGSKKAVHLEFSAPAKDASTYEPQFTAMVQSLKER